MLAEHTPATSIVPEISVSNLHQIVADLQAAHPAAGSRVEKGAALFLFRHVERSASGTWYVQSETDAAVAYVLAGDQCTCQDFQRHGDQSPCKRQFCRAIYQRAERLEADANSPICWELTPEAEATLAALGEPAELPAQCSRCHAEAAIHSHVDHLGFDCISRELFGPDAAA
jgi:hypothetical protein